MKRLWLKVREFFERSTNRVVTVILMIGAFITLGLYGDDIVKVIGIPPDPPQSYVCDLSSSKVPSVANEMAGKTAREKANIKGCELAKIGSVAKVRRGDFYIQINSMTYIEGGVEYLAQAWDKDNNPIGFGKDGTVEIERFRVYSPPINIRVNERIVMKELFGTVTEIEEADLEENLLEALLRDLEHTLSVKQQMHDGSKIVKDRVGSTTSTFNPADGGNEPVDGRMDCTADTTWLTCRDATTAGATFDSLTTGGIIDVALTGSDFNANRGIFTFDTSTISPDTVDSAVASIFTNGKNNNDNDGDDFITWIEVVLAATNLVQVGDFDGVVFTELVTNIDLGDITTSPAEFTDWTLNATGITYLNTKTSACCAQFAFIEGHDFTANAPTAQNSLNGEYSDNNSNEPKLVVEHSVAAVPVNKQSEIFFK